MSVYLASGPVRTFGCVFISGTPTNVDAAATVDVDGCCCAEAKGHVTTVH